MRNKRIPHFDRNVEMHFPNMDFTHLDGVSQEGTAVGMHRIQGLRVWGFRFRVRIQGDLFKTLPRG